jgi:hypothetical protein
MNSNKDIRQNEAVSDAAPGVVDGLWCVMSLVQPPDVREGLLRDLAEIRIRPMESSSVSVEDTCRVVTTAITPSSGAIRSSSGRGWSGRSCWCRCFWLEEVNLWAAANKRDQTSLGFLAYGITSSSIDIYNVRLQFTAT